MDNTCGVKLTKKKDTFTILSKISIFLFIGIILANVILYPLSLTEDETSGMAWFFLAFLPSFPVALGSIILSVITISIYFKRNKREIKNTILLVINVIQIILIITSLIMLVKWWNKDQYPIDEEIKYNIETIENV